MNQTSKSIGSEKPKGVAKAKQKGEAGTTAREKMDNNPATQKIQDR